MTYRAVYRNAQDTEHRGEPKESPRVSLSWECQDAKAAGIHRQSTAVQLAIQELHDPAVVSPESSCDQRKHVRKLPEAKEWIIVKLKEKQPLELTQGQK